MHVETSVVSAEIQINILVLRLKELIVVQSLFARTKLRESRQATE